MAGPLVPSLAHFPLLLYLHSHVFQTSHVRQSCRRGCLQGLQPGFFGLCILSLLDYNLDSLALVVEEYIMTKCVSLFRAINVGGRTVKMNELADLHRSLGLGDVLHYIQSGNVLFKTEAPDLARLKQEIEDAFATRFDFPTAVMLRTSAELSAIVAKNPFQSQPEKESNRVVIMFLSARPAVSAVDDLLKTYTGPEEIVADGQELYIYYSEGSGRSKLTNTYIEKKLHTFGTARNWNTVLRLQELIQR
jgi:uncharacterized protein (DUF1697 family)